MVLCLLPPLVVVTRQLSLLLLVTKNITLSMFLPQVSTTLHVVLMDLVLCLSQFFQFWRVCELVIYIHKHCLHHGLSQLKRAQNSRIPEILSSTYHACLARVYTPLRPAMTVPKVVRCPDGHFRHAIFSIGPYIADYPEQVWLAAIVQGWCPGYVNSQILTL